jgi:tripartite ATP-independent transporter DctP family solute receptor
MPIEMRRRTFLAAGAGLFAAPAILSLTGGRARAATTLTLGHGAAAGNPRAVAAEKFAELVKAKTNGEIAINIAGSEQLGNDVAMLTSIRTGSLDLTANSQGAASGLVPEIAALGLPFLFKDATAAIRVLDGPIGADLDAAFGKVGMIPLDWWDNGIRHVTNGKRPVATPADLKGLKIRTPADPMTIYIFTVLGAATQQIAFSELYVALQQGVVDGQENPLANIASSKLYEVNKYISLTAHKWESTPFLMSPIAAARVGKDGLAAIKAAAKEAGVLQRRLMAEADVKLLADFKADPAVAVNEVDHAAFVQATEPVNAAWIDKPFGGFVKRLIDAAKA